MELLACYENGNYTVKLYEDGTKVKENDLDFFEADFPESFDCKITNWCDQGCPMCHEKSNTNGAHGRIMELEFFNTLHPGTEIAIGGGKVTSHPDLIPFLIKLKDIGVFPSITIHQTELEQKGELIEMLLATKLIYGLGISFNAPSDVWEKLRDPLYSNAVVHLIEGIHGRGVYEYLAQYKCKVLILGYKLWGRGAVYYSQEVKDEASWLKSSLPKIITRFKVVSFDNLAIKNLEVQKLLGPLFDKIYQGDDGTHTMYIDAVNEVFARTSTSANRYKIKSTVDEMFKVIKSEI